MKLAKTIVFILSLLVTTLPARDRKRPRRIRRVPVNKQELVKKQAILQKKVGLQKQQQAEIKKNTPQEAAAPAKVAEKEKASHYGIAIAQNTRPYQEDRFDRELVGDTEHYNFFAVYDGHGGDKTSSYLQKNLAASFAKRIFTQPTIKEAFRHAFLIAEKYVLWNFDDGSTIIAAYIDKKNILHLAWVGDSRAVVEKNGSVGFATNDHKPDRPDEKKRIEKAGGKVEIFGVPRVNGLAVSRSIGDRNLKTDSLKGPIIALPEYAQVALTNDNHFLIMASDGLWDVMNSQEAIDFVKKKLTKTKDLNAIALDLQNEAIKKGSQDNITICIIDLGEFKLPAAINAQAKGTAQPSYWTRFWNWIRRK